MSMIQGNNYINGQWAGSRDGRTFETRNPARLTETLGVFPLSTPEDTQAAVAAAQTAFESWRETSPQTRAKLLKRALERMIARREEIARILTLENGKTLRESLVEIDAAINEMDFQIAEGVRMYGETAPVSRAGILAFSVRCPLGVAAIISPWNFPFNVPVRKVVPALMTGNTCVFKPASLTPHTGMIFTELFVEAGLPPGVLNFVTGSGRMVGDVLVGDARVKAISFTGSTAVGMGIHRRAAERLARTQLELGGKNPAVVLEDADLEEAVNLSLNAAFACAGQWCTSTSRVIVVREIAAEFKRRALAKVQAMILGEGLDESTDMGPLCGPEQVQTVMGYIAKGLQEGATLLAGGQRVTGPGYDEGCFIAPTLFVDVRPEMTIAQEEIFGPVLSILEVGDFEEAVAVANGVRYGLASSIFTRDLNRALTFMERTEAGLTHVNMMTSLKEPQLTFGGVKESGFGIPEAGHTGIEFFTEHKVAYVRYR